MKSDRISNFLDFATEDDLVAVLCIHILYIHLEFGVG